MAIYNSIREIQKDFQINDDNLEVLREQINEVRANNHPDKTHGQFGSKESENLYHKANSAITYIDSIKNNQSLVVVEKMTELMKVVTELIPNNKQNNLEQRLESNISNTIRTYHSKMFLPKISLTAITAIVTFLFLFPNQIKEHPTLSSYINPSSLAFTLVWIVLLLYSIGFWLMTFMSEEQSKRKLALLKVDSVQNNIFDEFLTLESERENEFTKEGLTHFIYSMNNGRKRGVPVPLLLFTKRNEVITMEIAQNVAEIIIARAEKNKVVRKVARATLCDTYEILDYIQE